MNRSRIIVLAMIFGNVSAIWAQSPDPSAIWKTLWEAPFDAGKAASVKDLTLVRDRIRITLADGALQFTQPVNGMVYGAAFRGHGHLQMQPPDPREAQQLRLFTKQETLEAEFTEATFSFTDNTFEEIAAKIQWGAATDPKLAELYNTRQKQREDAAAELLPRLYKGVLSADRKRTALFAADLRTGEKGWLHVRFDALEPEEITVGRWMDIGFGKIVETWMSFPADGRSSAEVWRDPLAREDFDIRSYQINATATGGAELSATTKVNLQYRVPGERVVSFYLDPNLRVETVKDGQGTALVFFQPREPKDRTQTYGSYVAVVLPELSQTSQMQTLEFRYAGKRVIRKVGSGSYFCESFGWYPARVNSFASRADFEINFRSPKRYTLVATGSKVSETTDGEWRITSWKSDIPLAVAGFAFGDYLVQTEMAGSVEIDIYANREPDDFMRSIEHIVEGSLPGQSTFGMPAVGSLSPAAMRKQMATEAANTIRVFEKYFGPYPYKHLAVTNIPYSYGQGWPGLIYLSTLSFLDSTQRNAFGFKGQEHVELTDFFRAHESSHQWWGHRVGWKSYHDQWLSEGFAEFSGNLYVQFRENSKEYLERWRKEKRDLRELRDRRNRVYESLGPIWMGQRLSSVDAPRAYSLLVYSKGGYVLHMLRMMLYDYRSQEPEARFIAMMKDFCQSYDNKPASTEDFKAMVEKHMTPSMDVDGNRRMDWFFNEYVYGMGIPQYEFRYTVQPAEGKWKVTGTLIQSGVPDGWKDTLPLYMHAGGRTLRLGFITARGRETPFDFLLPMQPGQLTINDNEDILAEVKQ